MFRRLLAIFAAFDRGEFDADGLAERLERHIAECSRERASSRKPTQIGLAAVQPAEP